MIQSGGIKTQRNGHLLIGAMAGVVAMLAAGAIIPPEESAGSLLAILAGLYLSKRK
jgi:hypothetical protein